MAKKSKFKFTIIEGILALAVVGLFSVVIFIALPALQQSQNETTRRNDISLVYQALVRYQTDNSTNKDNLPQRGSYTFSKDGVDEDNCKTNSACEFIYSYVNTDTNSDSFADPDGTPYSLVITSNYSDGPLKWDTIDDEAGLVSKGGGFTLQYPNQYTIYIIPGGKCDNGLVRKTSRRHFAILSSPEKESIYCLDDQQ